jgi:hypothetical protein
MYISLDEAITMHARMGLARFGSRGAKKRAISTAHRLRRKGDDAGAAVWGRVAAEIDRADPKRAGRSRRGLRLFPVMRSTADHAA